MQTTAELVDTMLKARAKGDMTRVRSLCEKLLKRDDAPHADLHKTLRDLAFEDDDYQLMEYHAKQVIRLEPQNADAHTVLAMAYQGQGRHTDALEACSACVRIDPKNHKGWANKARLHGSKKEFEATLEALKHALPLQPDYAPMVELAINTMLRTVTWDGFETVLAQVPKIIERGDPLNPYVLFPCYIDPAELQRSARNHAKQNLKTVQDIPPWTPRKHAPRDKIRVGFFSCTIRRHATGFLMREMIEQYDRSRFEWVLYPYETDEPNSYAQKVRAAFHKTVPLAGVHQRAAIEAIRQDDLDVLIDVDGFANSSRQNVTPARCAPVQVNWLGYQATMGAPYIDYIIADSLVIPPELEQYYDEAVARLPGGFFPGDSKRLISERYKSRADLGLPEDAVVLCAFHQSTKILPIMADAWAAILKRVPNAVLWLWAYTPLSAANLEKVFADRGFGPDRVIMAPSVPQHDHLCRLAFADVFLDTFPLNGHTTLSDVLYQDVPVVTMSSKPMATRFAEGLLRRLGLEAFVAPSLEAYEDIVVKLALDADLRVKVKAHINVMKTRTRLFDGKRYVREFERALEIMTERSRAGLKPESFDAV